MNLALIQLLIGGVGLWSVLPSNSLGASQVFMLKVVVVMLPELTKVALHVLSWPWLSTSNNLSSRLEVRLAVSPLFTNVATSASGGRTGCSPKALPLGLMSLLLGRQHSSDGKHVLTTEVCFVSVVELDGVVQGPSGGRRALVKFSTDVDPGAVIQPLHCQHAYDPGMLY
jgi:hypothetical protein